MLQIQRASAGSGKTYALARKFIINLITFKSEKGIRRIRNERQIEDALQHILAITFTNKATNEMKKRIVNNLAAIANAKFFLNDKKTLENIPYLSEIRDLTKAEYVQIAEAAGVALKIILNNYSFFKISTIDSFFQEILRTFAYEANLNDSYQLELDSTFVNDAALDAAIQTLDSNPEKMGNASFWLKIIMKEESKKSQLWNPFNKSGNTKSIYSRIRNSLKQLESEDFKDIKQTIEAYFDDSDKINSLPLSYNILKERALKERKDLLYAIKNTIAAIDSIIEKESIPEEWLNKNFINHKEKIKALGITDTISVKYQKIIEDGSVFKKKFRAPSHPLDFEALKMYSLLDIWNNTAAGSYYKNWLVYSPLLPYLGLILEIKSYLNNFLESNNLIRLSDTSYMLKKIIGEDDAPFVYERLGNRIDHYLIDEFQDTSRMQWDIIYPLLNEGVAKNKESLIIGDPKQSIYRFRNADHQLITDIVPKKFPFHIASGYSKEDNTNWRSHTNVVKFNNYLFKTLSEALGVLSKEKGGGSDFGSLYSNVIQYPHNQKNKGYIEVRFLNKEKYEDSIDENSDDVTGETDWFDSASLSNLGDLITTLRQRGYKQGDIGILVNKNDKGRKVVETLIRYNEKLPENVPLINFISEESLLVSSSPAVQVIIGVLEKIANPIFYNSQIEDCNVKENQTPNDNSTKKKYITWNKVKLDYIIFSGETPALSPAERMMKFLNQKDFNDSLTELLKDLPTPSLSSIVETIVSHLLDHSLRKTEAVYISSFQDLVIEYTSNHPDEPASFLDWWKSKGKEMSVASPEGTDAVQIMTIHKSKGLEFKCVIVPFATDSLTPTHLKWEWRWVPPFEFDDIEMPPFVPVPTLPLLKGSIHEHVYNEYYDQVLTDRINMYYVAFTRAKNELYIFTKEENSKSASSISDYLKLILDPEAKISDDTSLEKEWMAHPCELQLSEEENIITFGDPFSPEEIHEEYLKENKISDFTDYIFPDYFINSKRPKLKSVANKIKPSESL